MIRWDELVMDLTAVALVSIGVALWFLPGGLIVAGLLIALLSVGVKARRGNLTKSREVEE